MGFWRLTSPKICRSGGKLESQECWWFNSSLSPKVWAKGEMIASFQFISQQVWDPGRANDSLWACRQEKKSMTQSKGCHREIILPLLYTGENQWFVLFRPSVDFVGSPILRRATCLTHFIDLHANLIFSFSICMFYFNIYFRKLVNYFSSSLRCKSF